ncbi:MAG: SRPBCC domain-containing protein [Saprospiraceae bacterium]|nr:SRPBCC domain-containing protein [Saprospiraceae bacterium]
MREIRTETVIKASVDKVWSALMDFSSYPSWNPFIKSIKGEQRLGAKLEIVVKPVGGDPVTFRPRCIIHEPPNKFRWVGHLIVKGLFDGEHIFELKQQEVGHTHLIHREEFRGFLVPIFWKSLKSGTLGGFELMNEALRARCEGKPTDEEE